MPATPPAWQHAAKAAAARVERLLLEMLAKNEVGEVAVVVSWGQLEPEKRVTTKATVVKVGRGRMTALARTADAE
jgi:hypothetical protein